MPNHLVKTHADGAVLPREEQLAWKIAQMAAANTQADPDVLEMIGNRLIDNAAVAIAAINRQPVRNARLLALGYPHPHNQGARLFGAANERTFHCEWAALANGVAVRELGRGHVRQAGPERAQARVEVRLLRARAAGRPSHL